MRGTKKIFPGKTRFFIIKSNCTQSLIDSLKYGLWRTTNGPKKKLVNAFHLVDNVILIFSINESGGFQGIARMESEPSRTMMPHV
jgi:hypothetical protein